MPQTFVMLTQTVFFGKRLIWEKSDEIDDKSYVHDHHRILASVTMPGCVVRNCLDVLY